jgi:hypothetical protein
MAMRFDPRTGQFVDDGDPYGSKWAPPPAPTSPWEPDSVTRRAMALKADVSSPYLGNMYDTGDPYVSYMNRLNEAESGYADQTYKSRMDEAESNYAAQQRDQNLGGIESNYAARQQYRNRTQNTVRSLLGLG